MKKNNLLLDNALRSVMKRRAEAAERVRLSEDFTDRLMASIEKQKTPSRQKKLWPYAASLLAIAASVLLILVFQYNNKVEPEQQPVLAQQTEQQESTIIKEVKEPSPANVQETPVLAQAEKKQIAIRKPDVSIATKDTTLSTEEPVNLSTTADSLYYYLTQLENEMGECRDSTCLAELTGLMRADERIKGLVNKIIHKQVETAYKEEYLVDTTTHYVPL